MRPRRCADGSRPASAASRFSRRKRSATSLGSITGVVPVARISETSRSLTAWPARRAEVWFSNGRTARRLTRAAPGFTHSCTVLAQPTGTSAAIVSASAHQRRRAIRSLSNDLSVEDVEATEEGLFLAADGGGLGVSSIEHAAFQPGANSPPRLSGHLPRGQRAMQVAAAHRARLQAEGVGDVPAHHRPDPDDVLPTKERDQAPQGLVGGGRVL